MKELTPWGKVTAMVHGFGYTHVEAYGELIDMGEVRESDFLLGRAERADAGEHNEPAITAVTREDFR